MLAELLRSPADSGLKGKRGHFTRGGPLQPELLVTLLLYLVADGNRRGYRHTLDAFWDEAKRSQLPLPTDEPVSAPAFCKARRKLTPMAIRALLRDVAGAFDRAHGRRHRVKGRRIFAIDSSRISVQRTPELWKEFGGPTGGFTPQITVHVLFNVVAQLPVDAEITPLACDEREQVPRLVEHLAPGDVLILDRGYPSRELIAFLLARGIDFVIRLSTKGTFRAVRRFLESGLKDQRILLDQGGDSLTTRRDPLDVRAVRGANRNGHPKLCITSLRGGEFSRSEIFALYGRRWEIETFFRVEKGSYVGHDQFHARTADGVRQEVFALLLFLSLSRHLMASAARLERVSYREISHKAAVLAVGRRVTELLLNSTPRAARAALDDLLRRIASRLEKKRLGRSFPRRSFKPRPRWKPTGRCGGNHYGRIG